MNPSNAALLALVGTLGLTSACGDDDPPADSGVTDTGTTVDSALDSGVDGGPMGESLTVAVVDASEDDAAFEGATVMATSAAGTVMGMTAADGRTTLEGVVIEGATVEISAPGMVAVTVLNLNAAHVADFTLDGAYTFTIGPVAPAAQVTVTGTVSNGAAEGEWWTISPGRNIAGYYGADAMYSLELPADAERVAAVLEFDLQNDMRGPRAGRASEITTGRLATFPATAADATVDIDLAVDTLPVETATGTFPIPAAPHPMHDSGIGFFTVADRDRGWFLGESVHLSAAADNSRFDYEANWIAPTETTRPLTRYAMQDGPNTVTTAVDGWPASGAQDIEFPGVVDIVAPAFGEALGVGDTITATGIDPGQFSILQIRDESMDPPVTVWQVLTPEGGQLSLPAAPEHAEVAGATLGGSVTACDLEDPGPDFICRRFSTSRAFDIEL